MSPTSTTGDGETVEIKVPPELAEELRRSDRAMSESIHRAIRLYCRMEDADALIAEAEQRGFWE